jgi:hypothetical protein
MNVQLQCALSRNGHVCLHTTACLYLLH